MMLFSVRISLSLSLSLYIFFQSWPSSCSDDFWSFFHPSPLLYTLAFTIWLGSAWAQSGPTTSRTVRLLLTNIAIISGAAGLSWALHGYQNILAAPSSLLGLPVAVLSWFPILASRATNALCQPQASLPYCLILLLLAESLFPGKMLSFARHLAAQMCQRIITFEFRLELGGGRAQSVALMVLIGAGVVMWGKTLAAGYALNQAELIRLLWKLGSLVLLPLVLWAFLLRKVSA